jgi:deoxyribonuclease-4
VGICFDTCHVFAAGYDLRTAGGYARIMEEFDRVVGLTRIMAFHLNDCRGARGSRLDRHEHIGRGKLGLRAFALLVNDVRFAGLPMVLETPKGTGMRADKRNLAVVRSLLRR